jgi:hypothetical protein
MMIEQIQKCTRSIECLQCISSLMSLQLRGFGSFIISVSLSLDLLFPSPQKQGDAVRPGHTLVDELGKRSDNQR